MDEKEITALVTVVILLILVATIITLVTVFVRRKNKLIEEQAKIKEDFERIQAESQIEIREETLRQVSWELHDNIGQLVTLAKIQMQNSKDNPEAVDEAIETIGKSLNELRSLSKLINPTTLSDLSLPQAIQLELERFNRLKFIDASMECSNLEYVIENKIEIIIFRMLQEFFTNTIKHSKAEKLFVNLTYENKFLKINAEDDGVGFDDSLSSMYDGIGLSNIKNRAKLINADVKITSQPNKGTRFNLIYKVS